MGRARDVEAAYAVEDDYHYELSDEQLLHGLSMTPLQRIMWLDEARRFVLALRAAPRTYYRDGVPFETVVPKEQAPRAARDRPRTVGRRKMPQIAMQPTAALLESSATINETLAKLLPGGRTGIAKGIYRYRTLAEADRHHEEMIAAAMAAAEKPHRSRRRSGRSNRPRSRRRPG